MESNFFQCKQTCLGKKTTYVWMLYQTIVKTPLTLMGQLNYNYTELNLNLSIFTALDTCVYSLCETEIPGKTTQYQDQSFLADEILLYQSPATCKRS